MDSPSLQFHGTHDQGLLAMVLAAVVVIVLAWGIFQLASRRWRLGLLTLAAGLGPVTAFVALLVDGIRSRRAGDRRSSWASLLAAGGLLLAMAGLVAMVVAMGADAALLPALLAMEVVLAVGVSYSAIYSYLGTGRVAVLMALRCMAILTLMLVLFKPVINLASPPGEHSHLEILVDRSASMGTVDEAGLPDRYTQALQMLSSQQPRIGRYFQPVWRHFGAGPQSARTLEQMAGLAAGGENGGTTNFATAIRAAAGDYPKSDLAGIVLISDGLHNAADSYLDAAVEAGLPIYTVGVGSVDEKAAGRKNVQLVSVEAPLEAVANNVTNIKANLKITGYPGVPVRVSLMEDGGQTLVAQATAGANQASQDVTFKWTPRESSSRPAGGDDTPNVRKLRVVVEAQDGEAVADNEAQVHVLMTQPRIRVVYVEGTIRPEYRSLKRYLETDPNVEFMGLVRTSGNTFWAQGGIGGRKFASLPTTDEDFKLFDVLILGDLDRTYLTDGQMERIRRFVNDGGGLIMLGGHNSFGPGGYADTPIEQVLPVMVGSRQQPQEATPFLPQLTAGGAAHPVLEGITGYFPGPDGQAPSADLPKLPELLGCVTVVSAKPGASVLAVHPTRKNDAGPLPVLVVQQFGAGKSAAFTADTTRLWDVPMKAQGAEGPYQRFWGQMIRFLASADTKVRKTSPAVVLRTANNYVQVGEAVKIVARVQDARGQGPAGGQVVVTITDGSQGGRKEEVPLSPGGRGLFEGVFKTTRPGKYTLVATAVDGEGKALGTDQLPLLVDQHSMEMDRLARNDASLKLIAEKSGGVFADLSGLPDVVDKIVERHKTAVVAAPPARNVVLYNFTFLFVVFVAFLTGEWICRRRWQLH